MSSTPNLRIKRFPWQRTRFAIVTWPPCFDKITQQLFPVPDIILATERQSGRTALLVGGELVRCLYTCCRLWDKWSESGIHCPSVDVIQCNCSFKQRAIYQKICFRFFWPVGKNWNWSFSFVVEDSCVLLGNVKHLPLNCEYSGCLTRKNLTRFHHLKDLIKSKSMDLQLHNAIKHEYHSTSKPVNL